MTYHKISHLYNIGESISFHTRAVGMKFRVTQLIIKLSPLGPLNPSERVDKLGECFVRHIRNRDLFRGYKVQVRVSINNVLNRKY